MNKKYNNYCEACQELYDVISDEFGDRFVGEEMKIYEGAVYGKIDSKEFFFRPFLTEDGIIGGLALSAVSKEDSNVLNDLIPVLTKIMNGNEPICTFDLEASFKINDSIISSITKTLPIIEWDIVDPEKRIADIKAGKTLTADEKINNLCIYNRKNNSNNSQVHELTEEDQNRVNELLSSRQKKLEKYIELKREVARLACLQNRLSVEIKGISSEICQYQGHRLLYNLKTDYVDEIDAGSKPVFYRVCEICGEKVRVDNTKSNDVIVRKRTFPNLY